MNDYDARLVQLYDADNPDGPDDDFYRSLAQQIRARSVLDPRHRLRHRDAHGHARARPGAAAVTWVHSDAKDLRMSNVDNAVMTGNVAQHLTRDDWPATLQVIEDLTRRLVGTPFSVADPIVVFQATAI